MQRFPITKQQLQTFDQDAVKEFYKRKHKQDHYKTIINEIYNNIERELLINKDIKSYIWKDVIKLQYFDSRIYTIPYFTNLNLDYLIPEFVNELQKMFIDCSITVVDVTNSSIKISWE